METRILGSSPLGVQSLDVTDVTDLVRHKGSKIVSRVILHCSEILSKKALVNEHSSRVFLTGLQGEVNHPEGVLALFSLELFKRFRLVYHLNKNV